MATSPGNHLDVHLMIAYSASGELQLEESKGLVLFTGLLQVLSARQVNNSCASRNKTQMSSEPTLL